MDKRRTKYIVYVAEEVMEKPEELIQAVMTHLIRKDVDIVTRKEFLAAVIKAPTDEAKLEAIDRWVQIRDAATFPFKAEQEKDESKEATGGVPLDNGTDGE